MAASEWFENEEFWRIFGDCMFAEDRFRAAGDEIDDILTLTAVAPRKVLDLGCGPGRHCVPLALRGFAVTGVDLSALLLQRAAERAAAAGAEVEFSRQDMRRFRRPGGFDLIVSMWTSFGYFEDPADDLAVLENCHLNLRPGGALLLDVVGKEYVTRNIQAVHLTECEDGSLLIERPLLEEQMTRFSNEWILVREGVAHTAHWHHNLYSGMELRDRLQRAGFANISLYGGLRGQDYDLEAERLVAVAWK